MTDVIMPKMGDGMEEGTLLEWLKKDGDAVKVGEIIGTIQTDKATLELESPESGTLAGVLIKNGETVPVGQPIAAIVQKGESLPQGWGSSAAKPSESPAEAVVAADSLSTNGSSPSETVEPPKSAGRVKASPLARKIAQEKGIDLGQVVGSGPGGRIVEKDVTTPESSPATKPTSTTIAASAADRVVPLNRLRQITGQRTQQSKQQVPHFYVTVEVDVERILNLREMFEEEGGAKPSINDFVVRACALALKDMPEVNASIGDKSVTLHGAVNIGMAVAIDEGLTVPVITNADQLSLGQISVRSKDLVKKAKNNKLSIEELSGSTFSISNMGMLDVDNFVAIVAQPNAAILAISSARRKVVPSGEDEVEIRTRMNITGSFDHRIVDGAGGAKFVNIVRAYLENPTRLLG